MIKIIPAIDLIDGKCVRLSQGDYSKKTIYNENPLEVAKSFEDAGIKYLHLVDLDGAKQKKIVNHRILNDIASKTTLEVDFGGGVQNDEMVAIAFDNGAKQITGGSIAVKNPALFENWLEKYSAEKVILGADAQNEMISISGWEENSQIGVYNFIQNWVNMGVKYCISTDVSKDGMLSGPSFELYKKIQEQNPGLNIIASGGISCLEDVLLLNEMGIYGVIIGKAIYEGKIELSALNKLIA